MVEMVQSTHLADVLDGTRQWAIITGDVRAGLACIPDNVVHVCVTSPPYWGLRAYGTDPQVWGGDPTKWLREHGCAHEWSDEGRSETRIRNGAPGGLHDGRATNGLADNVTLNPSTGAYCTRCNAWRGELGSEPTPELFVAHMVGVFREVRRVLRPDGVLLLNIGDSYAGSGKGPSNSLQPEASQLGKRHTSQFANGQAPTTWTSIPAGLKAKDLVGIPWMLAFALRADGWWLRGDYIWSKPNPMPESATDRCTKAHEYIFHLTKSRTYYWDADAVREEAIYAGKVVTLGEKSLSRGQAAGQGIEPSGNGKAESFTVAAGRNLRSVWEIATAPFPEAHFATFPPAIPERAILAGSSAHGCCPTCGAPWRRVKRPTEAYADLLEKGRTETQRYSRQGTMTVRDDGKKHGNPSPGGIKAEYETLDWEPTCTCPSSDPIPCLVLDPFSGSGTTGLEAMRHGRRYIGLELNPEYVAMSKRRIIGDSPLFNTDEL